MNENIMVEKVPSVIGFEKAMLKRAFVMHNDGDLEGAITCYKSLITRFSNSEEKQVLQTVAYAMYELAYILILIDRQDECAETCDALITRFCDSDILMVQQMITYAMLMRAVVVSNSSIADLLS